MTNKYQSPAHIKAELAVRGWTLAAVSRSLGLYDGAARHALRGSHRAAAEKIAEILEVPLGELFPGLYINAPRTIRPTPIARRPTLNQIA